MKTLFKYLSVALILASCSAEDYLPMEGVKPNDKQVQSGGTEGGGSNNNEAGDTDNGNGNGMLET